MLHVYMWYKDFPYLDRFFVAQGRGALISLNKIITKSKGLFVAKMSLDLVVLVALTYYAGPKIGSAVN